MFLVIVLTFVAALPSRAADRAMARASHAMVVCADKRAADIGIRILKNGGNAVDAAVAVGFALAVVYPEAGNIGGGGYLLVRKSNGDATVVDFREKAPKSIAKSMFLDPEGKLTSASVTGHLAAGVPGTVAGLEKAWQSFGSKPWRDLVSPAVDLAREGTLVDDHLAHSFEEYLNSLSGFRTTKEVLTKSGTSYREGDTLRQPDLATTLTRIRDEGSSDFYRGTTARLILEEMKRGHGAITSEDLESYHPILRTPLVGRYRGYEIVCPPPSSSGGVCLLELLNIVEGFDLASMGFHSSLAAHVMAEAMRRVYADRAESLGDPDYVRNPVDTLVSKNYAAECRAELDIGRASVSQRGGSRLRHVREGNHTTHYVVIDESGCIASVTYTLNDLFGSKVVVGGAGFLLNDEIDDFSVAPDQGNQFGLLGSYANALGPEKRPLSSMCPVVVLHDGKPLMALGARGGAKIITAVFQTIVNVLDFGMNLQEAVDAPRFHHQWFPDTLVYEKYCFPEDVARNLRSMGHALRETDKPLGEIEALWIDPATGWRRGAPDPRDDGIAVGY